MTPTTREELVALMVGAGDVVASKVEAMLDGIQDHLAGRQVPVSGFAQADALIRELNVEG